MTSASRDELAREVDQQARAGDELARRADQRARAGDELAREADQRARGGDELAREADQRARGGDELAREADQRVPGGDELAREADAAVRRLYSLHARALHGYVRRFCPDQASADDIVQETFIRAWRHLPRLSAEERLVRAWLFRVARNLLTDAARARRSRPVTVRTQPAEEGGDDTKLSQVLDQQLVTGALQHLSPSHRTVLVETFYRGRTLAILARQLGIPYGTARSRLHYALQALRQQLEECEATGS